MIAGLDNGWKIVAALALSTGCGSQPNGHVSAGGRPAQGGSGAIAGGGVSSGGDAGVPSQVGGGGATGAVSACGVKPNRTAATAEHVAVGDDFVAASTTAMLGLASRFDNASGRFTSGPRWAWASGVEAGLTAYERTGGASFPNLFVATFDLNKAGKFIDDLGYDDEGWWGAAWVRAYDVTGDQQYLAAAKVVFDDMATAWDETTCNGGMWWNRQSHYKNAITSELFYLLAASLHRRLPDDAALGNWADKISKWWRGAAFVDAAGLVQDGLTLDCKGNNQTAWTYNQGVILGALVEMYEVTGDTQYLDAAKQLADASTTKLVTADGILREPCEAQGCDDNGTNFKGIYQRYLARLADATDEPRYRAFLLKNARSVWRSAQQDGSFGVSWSGPFDKADMPRQASAAHALLVMAPPVSSWSRFVRGAGGLAFNHEIGFAAAPGGWGCDASTCPTPGLLQSGPFSTSLPPGAHEARFRVSLNEPATGDAPLVNLEVYDSTSKDVVASRELRPSSFTAACVAQTFAVPFTHTAARGPLELRARWLAPAGAPELVLSDVALDGEESFAAASLEHDCGRLDASERLVSDRHHEPTACVLGRASGVALPAGKQRAWFELGVAEFWGEDAAVAELSVVETGGGVVATRRLQRRDFEAGLLRAFDLDFEAFADKRYDLVLTRLASPTAPPLALRAVYVRRAATERPLSLPFDARAVGNGAADGDADASGNTFPAESLAALPRSSATFMLGATTTQGQNALSCNGQTLPLDAAPSRALHVLLLATGGAQPDNSFSVAYAQGPAQPFTRSLSDWASPNLAEDEQLAASAPFTWTKTGKRYGPYHAAELTLPLDPSRTPAQLTLPQNPRLKLLAITLSD